jgi:membrane-associated phospholipid phosphatase
VSRRRAFEAALGASFIGLALLVGVGALAGVDQWSVDHLMPGLSHTGATQSMVEAIVPLLHAHWHTWLGVAGNLVTLPAQVTISTALAGACLVVLWRRGNPRAAIAWAAAWFVGNVLEVVFKSTITRPLLHDGAHPLPGLDSSYPSGHTLRSVLLTALIATVWPRAARWAAAGAAAVLVFLEIDGFHVPTDIAGGVLVATLLVLAVHDRTA